MRRRRQSPTLMRFNPRTRDGCEYMLVADNEYGAVSIHAPVMGAKAPSLSR